MQHIRTRLLLILVVFFSFSVGTWGASAAEHQRSPTRVFVDTDPGVDDIVAIAWLLKNPSIQVLGFTTVAGNTSVENGTQNLLTLLDVMGQNIPITVGATAPRVFPASRLGAFIHGPTGLWFSQVPQDISDLPHDAPLAIADAARANPGMTLLALGPLTNIAEAVERFPNEMSSVRLVVLAGAKVGGNRTPVAEANAFADPQALDIVLEHGLDVTLVTYDAFKELTIDSVEFPQELAESGSELGQFLAGVLEVYGQVNTQGAGGKISIPDAVAAIYVARPDWGTATPSLVDVAVDGGLTRGQTVMASDFNTKITMISDDTELSMLADLAFSDPNFDMAAAFAQILMSRPDNAKVVLDIKENAMRQALIRGLTQR